MKRLTSIIILTYNQLEYTRLCLDSIAKYTKRGSYEIVVVDNASTDGTVEWLKSVSGIKCIFNQVNKGFPAGCNQGMAIAEGSEILLLNNDVIVTPRWLDQMRTALYADTRTGAVSCVANSCSNLQQIEVSYSTIGELAEFAERYNHLQPEKWRRRNRLVGFCLLFKREIYDLLGGLEEAFSPGNYEDDDYSLRILRQGYDLLLCEDTFVHHFGSASFLKKSSLSSDMEAERGSRYNALLKRNFAIFSEKWHAGPYYGDIAFFSSVMDEIDTAGRVMYISEGSYGGEIYLLQGRCPGLVVHVISNDEVEAQVLSQRYFTQLANTRTSDVLSCFDEKYDYIFYKVDTGGMYPAMTERLINGLGRHLSSRGKLYFINQGKICVLKAGQHLSVNNNGSAAKMRRRCACCGHYLEKFAPLPDFHSSQTTQAAKELSSKPWVSEMVNAEEYVCPYCGAADRDRAYAVWMNKHLPRDRKFSILEIAPAQAVQEFIKENFPLADYKCGDFYMKDVDYKLDIMDMRQIPNDSVDFFICSHVLEHVRDDIKAMKELERILTPGGCGILVVPIDLNCTAIDEDPDCMDEGDRWRRFGQSDHVRKYSRAGYIERLRQCFSVELYEGNRFSTQEKQENALLDTSTLYIVRKKKQE